MPHEDFPATTRQRKTEAPKYSYDALKVLQSVWAASVGQCGKYLAASMRLLLYLLERAGELEPGTGRYRRGVRAELEAELARLQKQLGDTPGSRPPRTPSASLPTHGRRRYHL